MPLGIAAFVTCVALAVRFVERQGATLPRVTSEDWLQLAGVALALFAVAVVNGIVLRDLVSHFGVRLRARSWLSLTLVGSLLNLVSPVRGGAALRAMYLKRVHGVALADVATVLVGSTVCSLAVTAALGAVSIAALGVPGGAYGWVALAASTTLAVLLTASLWLSPSIDRLTARLPLVRRVSEAWRSLGRHPALLRRLLVWNAATVCLHAFAFCLAFSIASFHGNWLVPITSSAFARMGTLVAITPAGLGVFEAFGVVSATIVGAEAASALTGVLVVRVVGAAVGIVGGLVMLPVLMRDGAFVDSRETRPARRVVD
jgi:uncharacterized membrane protein YbhN (UPF0104 family)